MSLGDKDAVSGWTRSRCIAPPNAFISGWLSITLTRRGIGVRLPERNPSGDTSGDDDSSPPEVRVEVTSEWRSLYAAMRAANRWSSGVDTLAIDRAMKPGILLCICIMKKELMQKGSVPTGIPIGAATAATEPSSKTHMKTHTVAMTTAVPDGMKNVKTAVAPSAALNPHKPDVIDSGATP